MSLGVFRKQQRECLAEFVGEWNGEPGAARGGVVEQGQTLQHTEIIEEWRSETDRGSGDRLRDIEPKQ